MYACARLTTLPFVLGVFAQRVVELAASARRLTTSARAARGGCHRLGLDREFPAGGLMRRGELAVGDGRIALVLKLDLEAGLRETADDERLVQHAFKGVAVAQPIHQQLRKLGVMGAEIEIVGQSKIG